MKRIFPLCFLVAACLDFSALSAPDSSVLPLSPDDFQDQALAPTEKGEEAGADVWVRRFEAARAQRAEAEARLGEERTRLDAESERLGAGETEGAWWNLVDRARRAAVLRRLQARRLNIEKMEEELAQKRRQETALGVQLRRLRLEAGPAEIVVQACREWGGDLLGLLEKCGQSRPAWASFLASREMEYYRRLKKLEDGKEEAEEAMKRLDKLMKDEGGKSGVEKANRH